MKPSRAASRAGRTMPQFPFGSAFPRQGKFSRVRIWPYGAPNLAHADRGMPLVQNPGSLTDEINIPAKTVSDNFLELILMYMKKYMGKQSRHIISVCLFAN